MKIIERIFDATTGETTDIERAATAAEIADFEEGKKVKAAIEQAEIKKAEAQAKLAALGLTIEDLKAAGL